MADNLMEEQQKQRGRGRRSRGHDDGDHRRCRGGRDLADEGGRLARLVQIFLRAVEVRDFERRLQLLENQPTPSY
jgi:hypothetical protein